MVSPVNIQDRGEKAAGQPVLGDHSEGDPPVPIPNTAVKPLSPDCTARASVWESRKLPGISKAPSERMGLFVVCAEHVRQLEGESPFHNLMEVK